MPAPKPSGEDIARHYASAHERVAALVASLDSEQLATPVPATPGWTVHDVVAHMTGITTDALAGRLTGMPTDEVTAEQVATRMHLTGVELLAEWQPNVPPMCDGARAGLVPPNLAIDALTHEHDIREALLLPPSLTAEELRFATTLYAFGVGYGFKQAGIAPLQIGATDSDFAAVAGVGEPAAALRAPEYELFRALSGRRRRAQILDYDWTGDSEIYVDRLNLFGPVPA